MTDQLGQGDAGADAQPAVGLDGAQLAHAAQPDQHARHLLAPLHVGQEVGAAGHQHRLGRRLGEHRRRSSSEAGAR